MIKILYTYGMNFNAFLKLFNLKQKSYKDYENDYFSVNKDYWDFNDEQYWKENNLEIPKDFDDCHGIRIYYYLDYK